jgi:hypothetical protein
MNSIGNSADWASVYGTWFRLRAKDGRLSLRESSTCHLSRMGTARFDSPQAGEVTFSRPAKV